MCVAKAEVARVGCSGTCGREGKGDVRVQRGVGYELTKRQ